MRFMHNIIIFGVCLVFLALAGDATILRQSDKVSVAIDSVNSAIENPQGSYQSCFCVYRIGNNDFYATNLKEYKVLQRMVRLDSALKHSVAIGFIDKEIYESMTVAMAEAFNNHSPLEW